MQMFYSCIDLPLWPVLLTPSSCGKFWPGWSLPRVLEWSVHINVDIWSLHRPSCPRGAKIDNVAGKYK